MVTGEENMALIVCWQVLTALRRARRFQTLYKMFKNLSNGKRYLRTPTGIRVVHVLIRSFFTTDQCVVRAGSRRCTRCSRT